MTEQKKSALNGWLIAAAAVVGLYFVVGEFTNSGKGSPNRVRAQAEADLRQCVAEAAVIYDLNGTNILRCADMPGGNLFNGSVHVGHDKNITLRPDPALIVLGKISINCTLDANNSVHCTKKG